MARASLILDEPCPMRWEQLAGEGARRHCATCATDVVDATQLTERQARALLRDAGGARVCVRVRQATDGRLVFAPSGPRALARAAQAVAVAVGLASAPSLATEPAPRAPTFEAVQLGGMGPSYGPFGKRRHDRTLRARLREAFAPFGEGGARLISEPGRWNVALVRCRGYLTAARVALSGTGDDPVAELPIGASCAAKLVGDPRPQWVRFTVSERVVRVDVRDPHVPQITPKR